MTLIYALACVFVVGMFIRAIIGAIAGRRARVNEAYNNRPQAVAHVNALLDDVHAELDRPELYSEPTIIPFEGRVR